MKLQEVAAALGIELGEGSGEAEINGVAPIETAGPGQLSFLSGQRYAAAAKTSHAGALIVGEECGDLPVPTLRTKNPRLAFARAVELFHKPQKYQPGTHPSAVIAPSAKVGKNAHIGAYVVIAEDVTIGDDCVLLPHVVIYRGARIGKNFFAHAHAVVREFCQIGDNVILQNGAVIGADGFGFERDENGDWKKIMQTGNVVVENEVEVQALSCIDRAALGETRIGRGSKLDNLVQVGHSCTVGENSLLCAQVGLAGSTGVGKNVILAGQVGVAGHCRIGDGVVATAQSGIPNSVDDGKMVSGYPAIENKQWLRSVAVFNRLPEVARALRDLEKKGEKA